MINDERVSKIVNEVLEKERDNTVKSFLNVEKLNLEITGRCIQIDYRSMLLLYPMNLLEYVDNIEKTITYNKTQGEIIKKAQKQLERWIGIYESKDTVAECYEYLRQEKEQLDIEFRKNTKEKGNEESILKASCRIGGVALRNLQRENNNLDGEFEEYPYSKEEMEVIEKHNEIVNKMEIIEEYVELNYAEEDEEDEEEM